MNVTIRTPTAVMNTRIVKMLSELTFVPASMVSSVMAKSVEVKLGTTYKYEILFEIYVYNFLECIETV